jgi:CO/xanthine dehydrogenase Mo-binding subunit
MLYGKVLRSPYAHARIKSIDTRHAMELPGVHAVITSEDLAQPSGRIVDLAEGMSAQYALLEQQYPGG